mmetsp:Transcript_4035/g.4951  ORF Transcript_4035/g.4951 Transcript_4035/m.4951 type:complete len:174 (-) Transcript_4035:603-1124(-)
MATLITGIMSFVKDMGTLNVKIKLWASLFPFPQFIVGGYYMLTRGVASPAGLIFWSRAISFAIAGQISLRYPLTKLMAPAMHSPFLVSIPLCYSWLQSAEASNDTNMSNFILFTTAVTSVSLVLDMITATKWFLGLDVGKYKSVEPAKRGPDWLLVVPSLLMLSLQYYVSGSL